MTIKRKRRMKHTLRFVYKLSEAANLPELDLAYRVFANFGIKIPAMQCHIAKRKAKTLKFNCKELQLELA